jgi:DNA-binding CsgD family transcriptional regulator
MLKRKLLPFLLALLIFITHSRVPCYGQYPADSLKAWVKNLEVRNPTGNIATMHLITKNAISSPEGRLAIAAALEEHGNFSNPWFTARYYLCRAFRDYQQYYPVETDSVLPLCRRAIHVAYELGDEGLIGFVSERLGYLMNEFHRKELAVMYHLNAAEISEKNGVPLEYDTYWRLGEVLYGIREYEKAIDYLKIAASMMRQHYWLANCVNSMALSYQKSGRYDSALMYYDSALLYTRNLGDDQKRIEAWKGIISGNKGQVYFLQGAYDKALPLFEFDYRESKAQEIYDNAANSLQWAAKTNLVLGNGKKALDQIREAFYLLAKMPSRYLYRNYYQHLYHSAADIYRAAGMPDSAYYFSGQYMRLHDSLEAEIASSRIEISRMRLENEKNYYSAKNLQQQRQREVTNRNLALAGVILLAIIAILFINNKRVKTLHQQQLILEKSKQAEMEMAAAKDQLETFTHNLVEKTALIEQLQQQLNTTTLSTEQQDAWSKLMESTIITEEQWIEFKKLLEKIYPGFFQRLKESYPDITVAEQRMAALSNLKLTTKEMAAMLGISVESVQKTRQRLRQRLKISNEVNLEEFIASL